MERIENRLFMYVPKSEIVLKDKAEIILNFDFLYLIVIIAAKGDCAWCVAEIGVAVAGCIAGGITGGAAIIACVSGIIGAGIFH